MRKTVSNWKRFSMTAKEWKDFKGLQNDTLRHGNDCNDYETWIKIENKRMGSTKKLGCPKISNIRNSYGARQIHIH